MATTRSIKCPVCGAEAGKICQSIKSGKPLPDDHAARRLISINEAVRLGHQRLRKPIWANPLDHLKIDIFDGKLGPWLHLYAPFNKECNGRDPVDMFSFAPEFVASYDTPEFEVYTGPLPTSEEYRAAVAKFDGVLAEK